MKSELVNSEAPEVALLREEFSRAERDTSTYNWNRQADEVRKSYWPGQSDDGRKHGANVFPWDNASDTRIHLADELCNYVVRLQRAASRRAQLNAHPVESGDTEVAGLVRLYINWLIETQMADHWESEMRLAAQYAAQYGWSAVHVCWERHIQSQPKKLDLSQLVGDNPQLIERSKQAFGDNTELLTELLSAKNPQLSKSGIKKAVKSISEKGVAEFDLPEVVIDRPRIYALKPHKEIIIPYSSNLPLEADYIFRVDRITEAALRAKAEVGEWDEEFVEQAVKAGPTTRPTTRDDSSSVVNEQEYEVVYAYSRRIGKDGVPRMYLTIFSPQTTGEPKGKEIFASHELVEESEGDFPFVFCAREDREKCPLHSRGVPEIVTTWQSEYKGQIDMMFDRSSLETLPPIKVPQVYGQRIELGPGVQVDEYQADDVKFMDPTRRGPDVALQVIANVEKRAAQYFGRSHPEVPPEDTMLVKQDIADLWLRFNSQVIRKVWRLVQLLGKDERFGAVTGSGQPIPREADKHNIILDVDVMELDFDYSTKKLEAIGKVVSQDTSGRIDRGKLSEKQLASIDPSYARELIVSDAEASHRLYKEVRDELAQMALGNPPDLVENDPTAATKLQFAQQILESNPKYQAMLQAPDQNFLELWNMYQQNLAMSIQQQQNKQIGRFGVSPTQNIRQN